MSSSPSTSPCTTPTHGLSQEELAEREILAMMQSPPLSTGFDGLSNTDVDVLDLDPGLPPSGEITTSTSAASIRHELIIARRRVVQLKLHPYQRDVVEELVQGSSTFRQLMLFIQLCAVENQVLSIKAAAPPFVSSAQLLENIRSFVVAVLLSCKLSAYKKGSVPVDHVMTILMSVPRSYVPDNLASDSYALKVVKSDVQEELTQARSRIKKAIRDSLAPVPKESASIFDLTTTITANSQSSASVPLCARIALLRKIYVEYPDATFWDKVDARLVLIRTAAGGDAWKVTQAFEHILQTDRSTYGDSASYTIPDANDAFQNTVDDVIAGTH